MMILHINGQNGIEFWCQSRVIVFGRLQSTWPFLCFFIFSLFLLFSFYLCLPLFQNHISHFPYPIFLFLFFFIPCTKFLLTIPCSYFPLPYFYFTPSLFLFSLFHVTFSKLQVSSFQVPYFPLPTSQVPNPNIRGFVSCLSWSMSFADSLESTHIFFMNAVKSTSPVGCWPWFFNFFKDVIPSHNWV